MSALPPKADMCGANRHFRFGPIADMCADFDRCVVGRVEVIRHAFVTVRWSDTG